MTETSLAELARLFLRLGATAFGGPAAHVAMMRDEVVRRRSWMTDAGFLDLLGATNLIPGPNSTEMAIHVGWARRRWAGLVVAGLAFILPAALVTAALAWAYVRYGELPEARWLLYGVKPVILAIVLEAIRALAPLAARGWRLRALGVAAVAAAALGVHELAVLFGAGILVAVGRSARLRGPGSGLPELAVLPAAAGVAGLSTAASGVTLSSIFWIFCRTGSVLFGSGYVLLAFLRADFVERLGWLTEAQLIDAIAAGQVTPGPVFTTATFIGYVLSGPAGALAATAGIFLPAFVFVALSAPFVPRLRASRVVGALLDGVNVASLALMAVVTFRLATAAIVDVPTALLGALALLLLVRFRPNATWLVLGGAALGAIIAP